MVLIYIAVAINVMPLILLLAAWLMDKKGGRP